MSNKKGGSKLPIIIAVVALVLIAVVFGVIYFLNRPAAQTGTKAYTLAVVDKDGNAKEYTGKTDAEYLKGLMDEVAAEGDFSYSGEESEYGIYITTVNGIVADYDTDGAYWSIYVNGEYGQYGADTQPVNDGDSFKLVYEVYVPED